MQHIILHCSVVTKFRKTYNTAGDIDVTHQHLLLGAPLRAGMSSAQTLSILSLRAKLYIWRCKQLNLIPNIKVSPIAR